MRMYDTGEQIVSTNFEERAEVTGTTDVPMIESRLYAVTCMRQYGPSSSSSAPFRPLFLLPKAM